MPFRAGDHHAATVAGLDGAITFGESLWKRKAVPGREPKAQKIALALLFGPIHVFRAVMQDLMIVKQLYVAWFKVH